MDDRSSALGYPFSLYKLENLREIMITHMCRPSVSLVFATCTIILGCSHDSTFAPKQLPKVKSMDGSGSSPVSPQSSDINFCESIANELSIDESVVRNVMNAAIKRFAAETGSGKTSIQTEFGSIHLDNGMRKVRNPGTGEIVGILQMNFFANEETAHEFPDFKRPKPKPAKKSFPEFRVRIYKSDNTLDDDLFFENQIGDRTKFGGRPNFIQNQDGCICNKCNREMTFIGQVDSFGLDPELIAPAKEKQQWVLEDAGLIYFYVCYECGTGDCVLQSH